MARSDCLAHLTDALGGLVDKSAERDGAAEQILLRLLHPVLCGSLQDRIHDAESGGRWHHCTAGQEKLDGVGTRVLIPLRGKRDDIEHDRR